MQNFIRILILVSCTAAGIGLAVAIAHHSAPTDGAEDSASIGSASLPDALDRSPSGRPGTVNSGRPSVAPDVLTAPTAAVVAPYQGAVAQQIAQMSDDLRDVQKQLERDHVRMIETLNEQLREQAKANAEKEAAEEKETEKKTTETVQKSNPNDGPNSTLPPPVVHQNHANGAAPSPHSITEIRRAEGDNSLLIYLRHSSLSEVLDLLGEQGNLNILASPSVKENNATVTASLNHVDVHTALKSILNSLGLVARYEGKFIYVGTPKDFETMDMSRDRVQTRMYFPNYVKASEIEKLVTPLLTPEIGKISVGNPSEIGIKTDNTAAGGDSFAGGDVLLVRDYEAVLHQIDQIVTDIDQRPKQIAIEAMIISVKLSDVNKRGVDFGALQNKANVRVFSGTPLTALSSIDTTGGGLKIGFLDSSLSSLIDALETIGDTNVIASPRLTCLNKQRAEILIGSKLGYVSTTVTQTASTQAVQFLDVGTQLRFRPFISNDGTIRMEIHPELSTGAVRVQNGFTLPDKDVTEVTTNIMCQDGTTVLIGGLIRDELDTTGSQLPFLGNLPGVGFLFRKRTETTDRRELVVLITPHIMNDEALDADATEKREQFLNRQDVYADKMSPIGRVHNSERYLRQARAALAAGDAWSAFRYTNLAIQFNPQNRDAIALRHEIVCANPDFDASINKRLKHGVAPRERPRNDYSDLGFPWQPQPRTPGPINNNYDPGVPGSSRTLDSGTDVGATP